MKSFLKTALVLLSFTTTLNHVSFAQWTILREDADSLIRKGTEYIYDVQFDKASKSFGEVIKRYPEHPAGYFLDAMIDWWKISLYRETETVDRSFVTKIDKVIKVCDAILKKDQYDMTALFFKGGALGYRGRFYSIRMKWLDAVKDGKDGFDILVECWKKAPGNYDIMLGTGIYNYFAEVLPEKYAGLKPLTMFLPSGDKKIGILQLEAAAKRARYSATEAKVILVQIYYQWEENYMKAMEVSQDLLGHYPNNPYFHRYLARSYVALGLRDKWEQEWRNILNRCIDKKLGYDRVTSREALYYVGTGLMYRNDLENALKYLYKCDEACRQLDTKEQSGFMVRTNLYIGQIYDRQGKRDFAIQQYKKILGWKDYQNSKSEAEQYIKKPYGQR